MRARRGLSQSDYADLLGLDVRTLQNWEQGRNRPDPAAISLMRIFDRAPDLGGEVLTEPVTLAAEDTFAEHLVRLRGSVSRDVELEF